MADEMSVAIHKEQEWGLSPAYAVLSTVAPSAIVSGVGPGPVMFPRYRTAPPSLSTPQNAPSLSSLSLHLNW